MRKTALAALVAVAACTRSPEPAPGVQAVLDSTGIAMVVPAGFTVSTSLGRVRIRNHAWDELEIVIDRDGWVDSPDKTMRVAGGTLRYYVEENTVARVTFLKAEIEVNGEKTGVTCLTDHDTQERPDWCLPYLATITIPPSSR